MRWQSPPILRPYSADATAQTLTDQDIQPRSICNRPFARRANLRRYGHRVIYRWGDLLDWAHRA
jgi:hypothetical protein